MALNNFMHPRNIYRIPPDFGRLAKQFKEFSSIAKIDVTGKVTIDFKDPNSLRILTRCLLKSDFNVDIDIPHDRLVPTLPLRLNYILWIEDLLKCIERNNICGIDIGTGACAIYPVLAAAKNKWKMVGTESDKESLKKALENIKRNNLQDLIKIIPAPTSSVISHLLNSNAEQIYDFCMCNPPFYSNYQELCDSRNPARHPPKNGFTGSPQELITEGGELEFCKKLIDESKVYKDRVIFFTTMVGHKCNLTELLQYLKTEDVKYTHTEFCQGRVTRWGLAWTFKEYDIFKLVPPRNKTRKKNASLSYLLPELPNIPYNVDTYFEKLKSIFQKLQIVHKIINKRGNSLSIEFTAIANTWSHQRRKRRLLKRMEEEKTKKFKLDNGSPLHTESNLIGNGEIEEKAKESEPSNKTATSDIDSNSNQIESTSNQTFSTANKEPLIFALLKLFKKESDILFEVEFLSGSAGKEGLHQIVQYIKNNWK